MKMIPYEREKVRYYKKTKNLEILEEFMNSGLECAKIEGYSHKNAKSAQSCLYSSMKRFGLKGIAVVVRKGNLFLLRVNENL